MVLLLGLKPPSMVGGAKGHPSPEMIHQHRGVHGMGRMSGQTYLEALEDAWEDSLQAAAVARCIPDGGSAIVEDVGYEEEAGDLRGWRCLGQCEGLFEDLHNLPHPMFVNIMIVYHR